jgi:transcriptional regulator with XRE-family HTH domain
MDIDELIKKYGNQSEVARRFGVTRAYVSKWVKAGRIPERYALRELAGEVVQELESGEQNRSTQRLIRKIKDGLRNKPDAEGL